LVDGEWFRRCFDNALNGAWATTGQGSTPSSQNENPE